MAALQIAFLGYNELQTRKFFRQLAEANREQVRLCDLNQGRLVLIDGTEIHRVSAAPDWLQARRFDQVIVAGDNLLRVLYNRSAEMRQLSLCCQGSIVPIDYRYQYYDLDVEVSTDGT
jgi:hypothetical protein